MNRTEIIFKSCRNQIAVVTYFTGNPNFGLVTFRIIAVFQHIRREDRVTERFFTHDDGGEVLVFECKPFHRFGKFFPVVSRFAHFIYILPVIFIVYAGKTFFKLTTLFLLTYFLFPVHPEIGQAFRMETVSHSHDTYVEIHHIFVGRQSIDKIDILFR